MIHQDGNVDDNLDPIVIDSIKAEVECCPELNNDFMNGKDIYYYSIDDIYELDLENDSFDELQDELIDICTYMDTDFGWNLYFNDEDAKKANKLISKYLESNG